MRRAFVILSLAAGSAVLFGAGRPKTPDPATAEITRLRNHFDVVDVELRARDVSSLNNAQRARREQLRVWLREYRDVGMFPKNDRFDVATPFFRDSQGTLCAMAYLIDRSGRKDIVDKVAATRNNAYIRELADDPALIAWLNEYGLGVAEAARIQPSYNGGGGGIIIGPEPDDAVDSDFALAALGLGSVSLATSAFNIARPSYLSAFLGLIAGTAAIVTGANNLDENSGTERVATATIGLGAVSLGAAVYGLLEARRDRDNDRFDWREGRRKRRSLIIAPDVIVDQKSPRVGLLVRGSF